MTSRGLRRACGTGVLGALVLSIACGDDGPSSSDDDTREPRNYAVTVDDGDFFPNEITIAPGDSITWTWRLNDDHSVTSGTSPGDGQDPRMFDSGIQDSGNFGFRFPSQGSFTYFCREHWDMGMTGRVNVETP
jgi:plastocyanin